MIKFIKNLAKVCFPEYYETKRIKLVNAVIGKDVVMYKNAQINNGNSKESIVIGEGSHIAGMLLTATNKGKIRIGHHSFIGEGTRVYSVIEITIGNNVQIAHNVNIFDSNIHSLNPIERQKEFIINTTQGFKKINDLHEKEVVISDNAWIGAGSFILKGVTIGENTIVGAGSVVVKNLPPNVIAAGNPAKIIKTIEAGVR
jgi:acetyltransferase-like isoleucine patch superfamily enzyme